MNSILLEIYLEEIPEKYIISIFYIFISKFIYYINNNNIYMENTENFFTNKRIGFIIKNIFFYEKKKFKIIKNFDINKFKKKYKNIKIFIKNNNIYIFKIKKKCKISLIKNIIIKSIIYSINIILKKFKIMKLYENNYCIRPIRNILFLFNNKKIYINILNFKSNNITYNNIISKNFFLKINNYFEYEKKLNNNHIILKFNKRLFFLKQKIYLIQKLLNCKILISNNILYKYSLLVEYPNLIYIKIDKKFFINFNILIKILYINYNIYLLVINKKKKFLPYIIILININFNKNLIKMYKYTVINILKEIFFIFKLDKKKILINNINNLKNINIEKNLGSIYDKFLRIKKILKFLFIKLNINFKYLNLVKNLYKFNLTSFLVKEFLHSKKNLNIYVILKNKNHLKYNYLNNHIYYKYNYLINIIVISEKIDIIIGNLYLIYINNKNDFFKLNNDLFCIKQDTNILLNLLINEKLNISINHLIKKSILLYNFNNIYFYNLVKIFFKNRIKLFFIKLNHKKNIINSILDKKYKYLSEINDKLKIIYNKNYYIIIQTFKRIINLIKDYKNINTFKININNLSKINIKFYNIIINIKKKINNLIKKRKFELILKKIISFSNFINFLLNKIYLNKNFNNDYLYLLNQSINIICSINNIYIMLNI